MPFIFLLYFGNLHNLGSLKVVKYLHDKYIFKSIQFSRYTLPNFAPIKGSVSEYFPTQNKHETVYFSNNTIGSRRRKNTAVQTLFSFYYERNKRKCFFPLSKLFIIFLLHFHHISSTVINLRSDKNSLRAMDKEGREEGKEEEVEARKEENEEVREEVEEKMG